MDGVQIVSIIVAATAAIGAVLSYFKFKPGQREKTAAEVEQAKVNVEQGRVTIAEGALNVAKGSITLVTTELEDHLNWQSRQMRDLETRLTAQQDATTGLRNDMQSRIDELGGELRAEKAEKAEVEHKNERLTQRVKHLEDEAKMEARKAIERVDAAEKKLVEQERRRVDRESELAEIAQRNIEEERSLRRMAEHREAQHAAEVRRLWQIVSSLRDAMRNAGLTVPDHLNAGIGTMNDDEFQQSWSETAEDQEVPQTVYDDQISPEKPKGQDTT